MDQIMKAKLNLSRQVTTFGADLERVFLDQYWNSIL